MSPGHDLGHDNHYDPFQVRGLILQADGIGGDDILTGGTDDDLIYGQYGNDTFAFIGGGLGHDWLVESLGVESGELDGRTNDLHDRLDFSHFIGPIDIDLGGGGSDGGSDGHSDGGSDGHSDGYAKNHRVAVGDPSDLALTFHGDAFEDVIGSAFDDSIFGNGRDNILIGGAGDDRLMGRGGDDILLGLAGDDYLHGGTGVDLLDGGDGDDELRVSNDHKDDPLADILLGGAGDDEIRSGNQATLLVGEAGDDDIKGGSGGSIILGGDGNDKLRGFDRDDIIEGGTGQDNIKGNKKSRIEHDTGEGALGLDVLFEEFAAHTHREGYFVASDGDADGRQARLWLQSFLDELPGTDSESLISVPPSMFTSDGLLSDDWHVGNPAREFDDLADELGDEIALLSKRSVLLEGSSVQ